MKTIPGTFVFAATTLATVSMLALAGVWLLRSDNLASANPVDSVRIDLDISGNSVNQVSFIDLCLLKSRGDKFEVDVWAGTFEPEETLGRFDYLLGFDDTRLKINTQNHLMLLNLQEGSVVTDTSEAVPDVTSPHYVTATDYTAPEGGYTAPEPGVQGVLGRYEVEVAADAPPGLAWLSPADAVLLDAAGNPLTIMAITSAIVAVDVPCPTPFPLTPAPTFSPVVPPSPSPVASPSPSPVVPPSPSPSPSPMPMPTLTPSPGPEPTLAPAPSPTPEAGPFATPMPTPTPTAPLPTPTPAPGTPRPVTLPATGAGSGSGSSWPWWPLAVAGAVAGAGAMLLAYRGLRAKPH